MPLPTSSEWEYFQPDENNDTIHGMERMLPDGTAIDVVAYGTYDAPGEFSWMIRLWDDRSGYSVRASYDEGQYYQDAEQAYDALVSVLERDYPHLVENDEITREPAGAKERFFAKLAAIGLAAALAMPVLGGCASVSAYGSDYADVPLGTASGNVSYSQLISDDTFYEGYAACVDIMASGENPETAPGTGWYDGDFVFEDLEMDMLNYACYDNPMYSMYRTGADNGVSITLNQRTGDIRICSNAVSEGDDFSAMYAEVDAVSRSMAEVALADANGSTGEYVKSVMRQVTEGVEYTEDASSAHSNDIYGALVLGQSRCYGYASAVKYMLDMQGIPNFIATGESNGRHAWNMVKLDTTWYVVDATHSKSMMYKEGKSSLEQCKNPYFYCLRTLESINSDDVLPYEPEPETAALLGY